MTDTPTPTPVTEPSENTQDIALGLINQAQDFAMGLLRPWNAYQVGIIVALLFFAWMLSKMFGARMHEWMRARQEWPAWRIRFLVTLHKRLTLIFFCRTGLGLLCRDARNNLAEPFLYGWNHR